MTERLTHAHTLCYEFRNKSNSSSSRYVKMFLHKNQYIVTTFFFFFCKLTTGINPEVQW